MWPMKTTNVVFGTLLIAAIGICGSPRLAGQSTTSGSIEFTARVTPPSGQAEPVRALPFFLLRKSVEDIRREAQLSEAPSDMDTFVDGLSVSPELKAWMKQHHRVDLAGADFAKLITPEDIIEIPEFLSAYTTQNGTSLNMPKPKLKKNADAKEKDKYERQLEAYRDSLKGFVAANPDSLNGLEAAMSDVNPIRQWQERQSDRERRVEARTAKLAQTEYLASRAESDLNGRGAFRGVAPGEYWITTLDTPALAGELHLRWDVEVTLRSGERTAVELSNLNALEPKESTLR